MELYPFKFEPILKKVIWGGSEICLFKNLDKKETGIGESWELSHVPDSVSVVSNGNLKGESLTSLIENEPINLLGKKVYDRFGKEFPLLIKFIDAEDDLSIQVHPDDVLAGKRHNSFGKTEMWYVIDSKPGSKLVSGFSEKINETEYERHVEEGTIEKVLKYHEVKSGDVFFLPAGRVHAIGAGLFIAEIQQTSNNTYRIYDYKRKDSNGNERELHTELAKEAIDYKLYENLKTSYEPKVNEIVELVSCKYFTTNFLHLKVDNSGSNKLKIDNEEKVNITETIEFELDQTNLDSFRILICMKGEGWIEYDKDKSISIRQGETVLIPASIEVISLCTGSEILTLETYIPD